MKAGYGERIVNPSSEVELSGYGYYLERKAKEILDDLKVRALGMEEKGEKLILISCDILSLSTEFADEIRREISENEKYPYRKHFNIDNSYPYRTGRTKYERVWGN